MAPSSSPALAFFEQHKDLFEYDKFVATSPQSRTRASLQLARQIAASLSAADHASAPRASLPALKDLLIDASTRVVLLPPRRLDDAKKIELLLGAARCVGRISTGAPSQLPPSLRHRLDASHRLPQRREQLYALLRGDYERLTTL
ncbi:hypothetical protein ATCC90586_003917 [Pythium insidiosum]|nr:hypothetical protein ATCC90586_003917 [Pythium insidiosum]